VGSVLSILIVAFLAASALPAASVERYDTVVAPWALTVTGDE